MLSFEQLWITYLPFQKLEIKFVLVSGQFCEAVFQCIFIFINESRSLARKTNTYFIQSSALFVWLSFHPHCSIVYLDWSLNRLEFSWLTLIELLWARNKLSVFDHPKDYWIRNFILASLLTSFEAICQSTSEVHLVI